MAHCHRHDGTRRGTVVLIVLWAIAFATVATSALQLLSLRQARFGQEAVGRVQARWAARAGVERMIWTMDHHRLYPVPNDARAFTNDMARLSYDEISDRASYSIIHARDEMQSYGPYDEHAKLNINSSDVTEGHLLQFEDMYIDTIHELQDWIDADDDPRPAGIESNWYLGQMPPYEPRNAPFHRTLEMENVAGVFAKYFRGEDWNMNNRLDPWERDGENTWPPDNGDNVLDGGWAAMLTAYSRLHVPTASGEPRIELGRAFPEDLMSRLDISEEQAIALIRFGRNGGAPLSRLLTRPISHIDGGGAVANQPVNEDLPELTRSQLRALFDETMVESAIERLPGKLNINTVSVDVLRVLFDEFDPRLTDEINYFRRSRPQGVTSLVDFLSLPGADDAMIDYITRFFDVRSSVYTITCRGRENGTGQEVEMIVVVDRSTVPITIIEYREP